MLKLWMSARRVWKVWVGWKEATERTKESAEGLNHEKMGRMKGGQRRGKWSPCGRSELRSVDSCRWQNQLSFNLDDSQEHVLQTHSDIPDIPIFLLFIGGEVGVYLCRTLPPSSFCDYSFFKKQTSPWWAEFINKFGFDCMHQSPHHELICIHTSTLVDVPTTG